MPSGEGCFYVGIKLVIRQIIGGKDPIAMDIFHTDDKFHVYNWGKVNLFTRSRRFGKSLNMSMLKAFFEIGCDKTLFEGLAISRETELCQKYMGKFPVISISLKSVDGSNFLSARNALTSLIGKTAMDFAFLSESSQLSEPQKKAIPLLTAGADNQGFARYAKRSQCPTILKNVISISANGANTGVTFYQKDEFAVLQDAYAIKLKDMEIPNEQVGLFLASCISKILHGNFSWTYKAGWERIKGMIIKLPVKEVEEIDWEYMQERITELEEERITELRFKADDGSEFPDWEEKKIGDLFYKVNERNNGQFGNDKWISVAKMYYQDEDKVTSNNIDTRTYVMRVGDMAFEGHPNKEFKYGRFVVNDIGDGIISELFPIYRHKENYILKYWNYAIQIDSIMQKIYRKSITSSGASSNKLNDNDFKKQSILVPCLTEQQKIADCLSALDEVIEKQKATLAAWEELKKGLLQQMFV